MTTASEARDATLDALSRIPHAKERCVAPLNDSDDVDADVLCGKKATSYRFVDPVICPLCTAHAAEWDADTAREASTRRVATASTSSLVQQVGASRGQRSVKRPAKRRSTRRS